LKLKEFIGKVYRRIFLRRINGLVFGENVKIANKGIIISGSNSSLGALDNQTIKMVYTGGKSFFDNSGTFKIGSFTRIHKGFGIINRGVISIGNITYINPNAVIVCKHKISIGDNCAISWNVTIMDDDLHSVSRDKSKERKLEIFIASNVWIGANAFITKGVTIGEGAIIAANAVVTKDVPAKCLAAGNPAKIVKKNVDWQ
jgi:acetyltransferase-like isoleucine patch superfamily enzyme